MIAVRSTDAGRAVFAAILTALGIQGLVTHGFTAVWQPVPSGAPARELLVYLCALVSLGCGVGLVWQRTAAWAARVLLAYLFLWFVVFRVPTIVLTPSTFSAWDGAAETAVILAAAWTLYIWFAGDRERRQINLLAGDTGMRIARLLFGLALISFGLAHFIYLDDTASLVPHWLPAHAVLAYATGGAFVLAGAAVVTGVLAPLAAALAALQIGLFTLLVWVPIVVAGSATASQWSEFAISAALAAGAWVIADAYRVPNGPARLVRPLPVWLTVVLVIVGAIASVPFAWRAAQFVRHARVAAAREPAAIAAWRQAFGDPSAQAAAWSRANDDATAERLIVLARPLGIDLEGRPPIFADATRIDQYVARAMTGAGDLEAPPDSVRRYLDAHRAEIASIVDWLPTAGVPQWKYTASREASVIEATPTVSLLGIRLLDHILVADAFSELTQGRPAEADRATQAAWQLVRSMRGRSLLIEQLIALSMATQDNRAARWTAADLNGWRGRLGEYDPVAGIERAIEMEAGQRIAVTSGSLFGRAFLADYLDGTRATLEGFRRLSLTDRPGDTGPIGAGPPTYAGDDRIAPGVVVAEIAKPGLDRAWQSAMCTKLEVELTSRVFDAKQAKAPTGRWPATLPDVASAVVPDARWIYAAHAGDGMSISLSHAVPVCSPPRFALPR